MGVLPGLGCAGLSRGKAKATYAGSKTSTTSATSVTHTGVSIGTADAGRYVVVVLGHRNVSGTSNFINNITVGGISCNPIAARQQGNAADDPICEIWVSTSPVPTGTTADIVVDYNGINDRHCVAAYSVTGIQSRSLYSTTNAIDNGTGSLSASHTKREGGCTIVGCVYETGSGTNAVTFSGAEIVEDAQVQVASTTMNMAFASASDTTGATITVGATASANNQSDVMCVVSFYPG